MIDDGTYCSHELIILERARQTIVEANSLDMIKDIRDRAEAIRQFAKSAALGFEIQNKAAEIRYFIRRIASAFRWSSTASERAAEASESRPVFERNSA